MLKPGGFLLYVLPHSFLLARNAEALRKHIGQAFWVRLVADLSEIPVFDAGSYVILLILQRKLPNLNEEPSACIVRCREFVGHALQDALDKESVESDAYSIYRVPQSLFEAVQWDLLPPSSPLKKAS